MHLCRKDKVPIRKLVFYFDASGIQAAEVWASAIDFFRQAGILHTEYSLTFPALVRKGGPALVVSSEEALAVLQEESPTMFTLGHDAGNASQRIMLSPMSGSRRFYNFHVGSSEPTWMPTTWAPLIESMAQTFALAIASSIDAHYAGWQSCNDPEYYAHTYGSIEGFRVLRPLPPPHHDVERLDISLNPGRFDTCNGGPAFVKADLWLGPCFWDYAPCRKEEVLTQRWLKVRETEHFVHINAYPEPFTRPDGEQGEIQRKLWRLLFHSDCQWPPGSQSPT